MKKLPTGVVKYTGGIKGEYWLARFLAGLYHKVVRVATHLSLREEYNRR